MVILYQQLGLAMYQICHDIRDENLAFNFFFYKYF